MKKPIWIINEEKAIKESRGNQMPRQSYEGAKGLIGPIAVETIYKKKPKNPTNYKSTIAHYANVMLAEGGKYATYAGCANIAMDDVFRYTTKEGTPMIAMRWDMLFPIIKQAKAVWLITRKYTEIVNHRADYLPDLDPVIEALRDVIEAAVTVRPELLDEITKTP